MACWAGARLNDNDPTRLDCYRDFGRHLGLLIQILDDLEEFKNLNDLNSAIEWRNLGKSLPVVYTLQVLQEPEKTRFIECLKQAGENRSAVEESQQIMEDSGVVVYLLAEIARHSNLALTRLQSANPEPLAGQYLAGMVERIQDRA